MLKNILDACGGAIGFYFVGYAFAYGGTAPTSQKTFIGNTYFALKDFDDYASFFFQFAFAATAATIVAGTGTCLYPKIRMRTYVKCRECGIMLWSCVVSHNHLVSSF